MKTFEFDVHLKSVAEIDDDLADALFAAGCDDGTPASCDGKAWIHFDREAETMEDAIRSAISQIAAAGYAASTVELDAASVACLQLE